LFPRQPIIAGDASKNRKTPARERGQGVLDLLL